MDCSVSRVHVVRCGLVQVDDPPGARARVDLDLGDAREPVLGALLRAHARQVAAVRARARHAGRASHHLETTMPYTRSNSWLF